MDVNQYVVYAARLEDLGLQILDLVAEMRADPPDGWEPPSLAAAARALGLAGTESLLRPIEATPETIKDLLDQHQGNPQAAVDALLAMGVSLDAVLEATT